MASAQSSAEQRGAAIAGPRHRAASSISPKTSPRPKGSDGIRRGGASSLPRAVAVDRPGPGPPTPPSTTPNLRGRLRMKGGRRPGSGSGGRGTPSDAYSTRPDDGGDGSGEETRGRMRGDSVDSVDSVDSATPSGPGCSRSSWGPRRLRPRTACPGRGRAAGQSRGSQVCGWADSKHAVREVDAGREPAGARALTAAERAERRASPWPGRG